MSERRSGDGGGREFQRVAEELRGRIAEGAYPLRSFLPSQRDLSVELRVSRDTVQRVLRELVDEGWIESRQGSGSRVIKVPTSQPASVVTGRLRGGRTLGSLLDEAFEQPEVTLDVYSLTSESLAAHLQTQVERIVNGVIAPQSLALRLLLPSEDVAMPYPRPRDDPDDPRLTGRLHEITRRSTASVRRLLTTWRTEGLVPDCDLLVRQVPLVPAFKLYLVNGVQALLAPYEVIERDIVLDSGATIPALDVLGFGAPITQHVKNADPDSPDSLFVVSWQRWFDSLWKHVSQKFDI
ncbi:GntR family transcriptional regulator [Streptomyces sp. NPDC002588]|uniref:GntR family transcriptional regulator n=1 Tax=Streptomyces sp. NPDC002588 TaxID=3154419 RepID=UPI0033181876